VVYLSHKDGEAPRKEGKKMIVQTLDGQAVINCFGLGAHDHWDRNLKKAKRDGLEPCAHCAQGMQEGTGWLIRWDWTKDIIVSFDSEIGEIRRIGNSCVKHFMTAELKDSHFRKVGA